MRYWVTADDRRLRTAYRTVQNRRVAFIAQSKGLASASALVCVSAVVGRAISEPQEFELLYAGVWVAALVAPALHTATIARFYLSREHYRRRRLMADRAVMRCVRTESPQII